MSAILEKQQIALTINTEDKDESVVGGLSDTDWMIDMTTEEEEATDEILDYLIQNGARIHINATGSIIDVITAIVNRLKQSVPDTLSAPLKIMMDYIVQWLCAYVRNANITALDMSFGFNAQTVMGRAA